MRNLAILLTLTLMSCAPDPPCPDEACLEARRQAALMVLGIIQHNNYMQQQILMNTQNNLVRANQISQPIRMAPFTCVPGPLTNALNCQ